MLQSSCKTRQGWLLERAEALQQELSFAWADLSQREEMCCWELSSAISTRNHIPIFLSHPTHPENSELQEPERRRLTAAPWKLCHFLDSLQRNLCLQR